MPASQLILCQWLKCNSLGKPESLTEHETDFRTVIDVHGNRGSYISAHVLLNFIKRVEEKR